MLAENKLDKKVKGNELDDDFQVACRYHFSIEIDSIFLKNAKAEDQRLY